jgi:hypothetical protein
MSAIPTNLVDLRAWLKKPHNEDDPAIAAGLRAALSAWESATGRAPEDMTEEEWMAVRLQVGHLEAFRGDDAVTPEPHPFIQTIRRMHSDNSIG